MTDSRRQLLSAALGASGHLRNGLLLLPSGRTAGDRVQLPHYNSLSTGPACSRRRDSSCVYLIALWHYQRRVAPDRLTRVWSSFSRPIFGCYRAPMSALVVRPLVSFRAGFVSSDCFTKASSLKCTRPFASWRKYVHASWPPLARLRHSAALVCPRVVCPFDGLNFVWLVLLVHASTEIFDHVIVRLKFPCRADDFHFAQPLDALVNNF